MQRRMQRIPERLGLAAPGGVQTHGWLRGAGLLLLGVGVGWFARPRPAPAMDPRAAEASQRRDDLERDAAESRGPRKVGRIERPFLIKPDTLYTPSDDAREQEYLEKQSHELVDLLTDQLDAFETVHPAAVPEAVANQWFDYQSGLFDGVIRTAPELVEALSDRVEQKMCDPSGKPSHQIALARLIRNMPEVGSERAFDCVFSRTGEDLVLWSMLDAFATTGQPKPPALLRLEQTSTDPRTLRRLKGHEQYAPSSDPESESPSAPSGSPPVEVEGS